MDNPTPQPPARLSSSGAPTELWRMEAREVATLIRHGRASAREAVESCLSRLEKVNPVVNAVARVLADEARAEADRADAAQRRGEALGALHGVPVTIKVNIDQTGLPTDNGVVAYKNLIAIEDNPVVRNFRHAGAIVIGRTNTPCYSMRWFTDNALHGLTLNPWDAKRTCGGSSGGAAAAVATGMGPIAHGNDIAGSVRYPAYCCGLVGLRPSYGRVPSFNASATGAGTISSALMAVQGPLTRTVADNRLAFAAMAREDLRDARWTPVESAPERNAPLRVALVRNGFGSPQHPAVTAALDVAAKALAAAGYIVEEIAAPALRECAALWPQIAMPDVIASLEPLIEKNGDDGIKRAIALWRGAWPKFDAADALAGLGQRLSLLRKWRQFLVDYPVVLMPVSLDLPFPVGSDVESVEATARILAAQAPMTAISVLGLPGLAVPTGLHEGVPVGVQIVAGQGREDLCFDAAETIEAHASIETPIDPRNKD
ncbi:amidase [Terrarubrum flagellatum]|uniref:amidase n=1 Tax=Terrirubrum flagellatum TaxID=2895980 RepID=UPI0031453731